MRLRDDESIADFCSRYEVLANKAGVNDEDTVAMDYLVSQLPHELMYQVQAAIRTGQLSPPTIPRVSAFAASMPSARARDPREVTRSAGGRARTALRANASSSSDRQPMNYCTWHRATGHPTSRCRAKARAENRPYPSPAARAEQSARNMPVKCYRCGQEGHYAYNCNAKV